jgi:hypothetical protein
MNSLGIKMHLDGDVSALESGVINKRAFNVCHTIVLGLKEKCWWCLLNDVDLGIKREVLVGKRQVTRIDNHGKIRAAANLVSGIGRLIQPLVEVRTQRGCQMAPGGKAQ